MKEALINSLKAALSL